VAGLVLGLLGSAADRISDQETNDDDSGHSHDEKGQFGMPTQRRPLLLVVVVNGV
jgi:hypothetical protein